MIVVHNSFDDHSKEEKKSIFMSFSAVDVIIRLMTMELLITVLCPSTFILCMDTGYLSCSEDCYE